MMNFAIPFILNFILINFSRRRSLIDIAQFRFNRILLIIVILTKHFFIFLTQMNSPQYLTPRIALVTKSCFGANLHKTVQFIISNHRQYVHIFNFTKIQIPQIPHSQYKWRGIPYSISETFKVMADLDAFLRKNHANTAVFFVQQGNLYEYANFIVLTYLRVCEISSKSTVQPWPKKIIDQHPNTLRQIQKIYQGNDLQNPPLKLIESIYIQPLDGGQQPFIPVFKIFSQTRYNQFENIYNHAITDRLGEYYFNKNKGLKTSIGQRYDECKPQTQFMLKPVIVAGDVKIEIFSFKQLKLKEECVIGFSTKCLQLQVSKDSNGQTCQQLIFSPEDLYNDSSNGTYRYAIHIRVSKYCDNPKCQDQGTCPDCKQHIKKIANRYFDAQQSLQKVKRQRKPTQIKRILSI